MIEDRRCRGLVAEERDGDDGHGQRGQHRPDPDREDPDPVQGAHERSDPEAAPRQAESRRHGQEQGRVVVQRVRRCEEQDDGPETRTLATPHAAAATAAPASATEPRTHFP